MGEVITLSLFVGSLGLQAVTLGGWMRWQQSILERHSEEEEETLTPYESKDTVPPIEANGSQSRSKRDPRLVGWEFKIVRANRDLFRDPVTFARLCEEESHAGWILLEKLDDRRVRFKRPIALRDILKSEMLSIDPYRTHYGPTSSWGMWLGAIAVLTAIVLPAYLGYALVSKTLNQAQPQPSASPNLPSQSF